MTPDEREIVNTLCKRIRDEQDPETFNTLVTELDQLLEATGQKIFESTRR